MIKMGKTSLNIPFEGWLGPRMIPKQLNKTVNVERYNSVNIMCR